MFGSRPAIVIIVIIIVIIIGSIVIRAKIEPMFIDVGTMSRVSDRTLSQAGLYTNRLDLPEREAIRLKCFVISDVVIVIVGFVLKKM